jgi:urease accessory protein
MPFETREPASRRLGISGAAEIGFAHRLGATRLVHLYQHDPLRVLFPAPEPGEPPMATLVTTSGGLVGGDQLRIAVELGAEAAAQVATQAAEKIYRSAGPDTRIEMRFNAGAGAWLEYLPHETILFDGARLRRAARVELAPGAAFLGGEILVLGRAARGERLTHGLVRDAWEIRVGGRPVWADAFHLAGDLPKIWADPACLAGAEAVATLLLAAADAPSFVAPLRERLAEASGVRSGVSAVNGVVVARFLGAAPAVRRGWSLASAFLRAQAGGWAESLPRLWHV